MNNDSLLFPSMGQKFSKPNLLLLWDQKPLYRVNNPSVQWPFGLLQPMECTFFFFRCHLISFSYFFFFCLVCLLFIAAICIIVDCQKWKWNVHSKTWNRCLWDSLFYIILNWISVLSVQKPKKFKDWDGYFFTIFLTFYRQLLAD